MNYIHNKANASSLTLNIMLLLHKTLISNIQDDIAGRFRQQDEWVRVGSHIAADPAKIDDLLHEMLASYQSSEHQSVIQHLARFHLTFENLHPFVDGNGRIGRVLNKAKRQTIAAFWERGEWQIGLTQEP